MEMGTIMVEKTCKQCGKTFQLSDSEIEFYKSKNLELPKRCKECRKSNQTTIENVKPKDKDSDSKTEEKPLEKQTETPPKKSHSTIWNRILSTLVLLAVLAISAKYGFHGDDTSDTLKTNSDKNIENSLTEDKKDDPVKALKEYEFRKEEYLEDHFKKHGAEFEYKTAEEYEAGANRVINTEGVLHKIEKEDGDDVYYLEETNEFVIVSTDGYIRTYFKPTDGIDYYNRQ